MTSQTILGFPGLGTGLTLIFAAAKLLGHFPYSWWWVFAPVIATTGLAILIIVLVVLVICIAALAQK